MNQPSLTAINQLDQAQFVALLGGIYELSPWIAQRAWAQRPFASVAALRGALARSLDSASEAEKLAVLRAHPELAGKAAIRNELTEESRKEQGGAGLDQCSPEEFAQLQAANRAYSARFGFPFIIAVKGLGRAQIISALTRRLESSREMEFAEALAQVHRIAGFRLADKVGD
jgi:2-oxo-4-hydroxy-4-carboxy-5-ureidoimidazoline decarboxylase